MGALISWLFSFLRLNSTEAVPLVTPTPPVLNYVDEFPNVERFSEVNLHDITQNDPGLESEFITEYIQATNEELEKLEKAIEEEDATMAEIKSHSIKGSARYVCAEKVSRHAMKLEILSKAGKLEDVKSCIPALKRELQLTEVVLKAYQDRILSTRADNHVTD
eukprot:TRINITY_DN4631_c0_g2_i2.p1 TRINITY_DN4631_c0_g2~~TRINITY_DN4631_c0_g2_i2.p1  ORF type:complete len:163 (-),score=22.67 TRINITY_DN4631_c0_g2_i2:217-705(-)